MKHQTGGVETADGERAFCSMQLEATGGGSRHRDIRSKHDNSTRVCGSAGIGRRNRSTRSREDRVESGSREKIRSTLLFDVLPLLSLSLSLSLFPRPPLLGSRCTGFSARRATGGKTNAFQEGEETDPPPPPPPPRSFLRSRISARVYTGRIVTHTAWPLTIGAHYE